ncbi:MAG: NAD(P)H-dependent oxidoreductase subunit E [Deltaproteobacteria bacterium]|nr:NAD(P)H-dependent oxidoreductase subunit E [Deltaproteobacteria bacterium]
MSEAFVESEIRAIADRWAGMPGMVTGALQEVQSRHGHLQEGVMADLATALDVPLSRLFSVATFFAFFRLVPKGESHIQVCMGTACHVLGAPRIRQKLERDLGVDERGVTPDRAYSVEEVRCLGCCSLAPVVRINEQTYGRVRMKDLGKLIKRGRPGGGDDAHQNP